MATEPPNVPQGMRRVHRRFARWRSAHPGVRLPIPGPLWASAAEVARENGVGRTAQLLRLEYGKLKRLAESGSAGAKSASKEGPPRPVRRATAVIHGTGRPTCDSVCRSVSLSWKGRTARCVSGGKGPRLQTWPD